MREGDAAFEALRAAIDELAAADAPDLLAEARAEARAKVRSILTEAMAQALLDHSSAALSEEERAEGAARGGAPERAESREHRPGTGSGRDEPEAGFPQPRAPSRAREAEPPRERAGDASRGDAQRHESARASTRTDPTAPPRPTAPPAEANEPPSSAPAAPAAVGSLDAQQEVTSGEQPAPASGDPAPSGPGLYVYCVLPSDGIDIPDDLTGVGGSPSIALVRDGDIAALASEVPLEEFGEERLRENLNDVAWLEDTALAHERVLEVALVLTTVIPMRLCTIYANESSVREMLVRERPALVDALGRLDGRTEWGVKVFVDRAALDGAAAERSEELAALREEVEALPEGEAYMKRKQLDTLAREEADLLVDACVDDVHGRVAARATEALLNPLQRPEVSGHEGEMLLNGVYLVEDVEAEAFHATVDELRNEYAPVGFAIEPTGPWPPYNFVKSSIEAAR